MTTDRQPQRNLPKILDELATSPYPDYIDNVLTTTVHARQRPGWTFPGRWIPMTAITSRAAPRSRIPWRIVAVAALLLIALALGVAFVTGSRPRVLPPFGPAANGHVTYASGGDIYTADPVTGLATAVITGPDDDSFPLFSRDGTHIGFVRHLASDSATTRLYVARADGTNVVAITPNPPPNIQNFSFSPDGRSIVFAAGIYDGDHTDTLWLANADGSGLRKLETGLIASAPSFLPPSGAEVLFSGKTVDGPHGVYAVNVATGAIRTIVAPTWFGLDFIAASPDGSRIAYSGYFDAPGNVSQVHVITQAGSDVTLPMPHGAVFQDAPTWSNDGTRLVVTRGYAEDESDNVLAVVPADGSGPGRESTRGLAGCCDTDAGWAPDDQSILALPLDPNGSPTQELLVDPATMHTKPAPWTSNSVAAWQRAAP